MTSNPTDAPAPPLVNWDRLDRHLAAAGVDALLVGTPQSVTYLSDHWNLSQWSRPAAQVFALAVRGPDRHVELVLGAGGTDLVGAGGTAAPTHVRVAGRFVCDRADGPLDAEATRFADLLAGADGTGLHDQLVAAVAASGAARVAVEPRGLTAAQHAALAAALPSVELVDGERVLAGIRAVKSTREIHLLAESARATERAIAQAFGGFERGNTERDVVRAFLAALPAPDAVPLFHVLTSGPRTAMPNGQASDRVPADGDLLRFDGGCRFGHYTSDIARMAVLGGPSPKQEDYYAAVVVGLEAATAVAGPGVPASACFDAAVRAVRRNGIPHYRRHHCGHGIGIDNYDLPAVTPDSTDVLEAGMVICLETPYYELGWGGVQAEDTMVITADGVERFTHQPAELTVLR